MWNLIAKLPNSDFNFALDFSVDFFLASRLSFVLQSPLNESEGFLKGSSEGPFKPLHNCQMMSPSCASLAQVKRGVLGGHSESSCVVISCHCVIWRLLQKCRDSPKRMKLPFRSQFGLLVISWSLLSVMFRHGSRAGQESIHLVCKSGQMASHIKNGHMMSSKTTITSSSGETQEIPMEYSSQRRSGNQHIRSRSSPQSKSASTYFIRWSQAILHGMVRRNHCIFSGH